ncbi:hypothetical protein DICSQDRAFT_151116 [Dichomitus squalens LYAD-421 SS1]|uniref:t-SNARE coiled-coil homology domain-containing protein n=1 Tax=Dichomitus squalens TaxID=114155 RepID=A0A4Q9QCX9_9APHY|nr:uncharacterized protein DICSQDRAFT_151116 [Dichomitus squalens LYAD-421 SS1]EJF66666.1 hypothetical protein DICSQDRAFT_151116 [Dichomitus squalens LYAD-421 SS1]TBU65036.1 hypothetical protein BD310DRAFT_866623 [Dichomitus squalens]
MAFWRKSEKTLIPPVQSEESKRNELLGSRGNSTSSRPPSNFSRSTSSTYVASRDGDPYNSTPSGTPPPQNNYGGDRYVRQNAVGDPYSRGRGDINQDRNELFSGYKPPQQGSGRFFNDGPTGGAPRRGTPPPGEENEEDVEGIKQDMRFLKQDSVNSTRNALRLAREAEETARNTVSKLGSQSEKLADTERHLDVSKGYSLRAADKTDELKQLNRSIFRPVITFNKDAKRAAQEAKIQARYDEERANREEAMRDIRDTQDRLGRAATYGVRGDDEGIAGGSGRFRTATQLQQRKEQRKRYQFEADEDDDALEDELDDNLDEIMDVTKRLKALGTAMGSELDTQNDRITRITQKTDGLDQHLFTNTQRLNRIK